MARTSDQAKHSARLLSTAQLATPTNWTDTSIQVPVPVYATTGSVKILLAGVSSNSVSFSVAPGITNIMPASSGPGATVTIMGHDFGATQPTGGAVSFNGSSATIVSWSSNAIAVLVPSAATTGQVVVTAAGGITTNGVSFAVTSSPVISTISTTSGIPGTKITIDGSGFGSSQGQAIVLLGNTYGGVVSWSDTEVIGAVASNARSGVVQVVRGGIGSNTFIFTVPIPTVSGVNPSSGAPGDQITISGAGFGATEGAGIVWVGSTYGVVSSWNDNQIVCTIASSSRSGTVKVLQGGAWSDPTQFTVSSGSAPSVTLTPGMINMYIGETRGIRAIAANGSPVVGLTWASSNASIVSLSTDDPPILTASAAGHVTITAGDGKADIFVAAGLPPGSPVPQFPDGTVRWSIPGDFTQIIPAVPSPQGVADTFGVDGAGNIEAVTTDGLVAWKTNAGADTQLVADFQGGLVAVQPQSPSSAGVIQRIDGITGSFYPPYTFLHPCGSEFKSTSATWPYSLDVLCNKNGDLTMGPNAAYYYPENAYPPVALHPDGTLFTVDGDSVVGIDPTTGTAKFRIPIEHQHFGSSGPESDVYPYVFHPVIAGDGFAYVPYECFNTDYSPSTGTIYDFHFRVLRVGPDGSSTKIVIADFAAVNLGTPNDTESGGYLYYSPSDPKQVSFVGPSLRPRIVTNRDQGVLLTWTEYRADGGGKLLHHLTTLSSGGVTSDVTLDPQSPFVPITPVLQKEDGTYIGVATTNLSNSFAGEGVPPTATNRDSLISFDLSGNISVIASNTYQLFNPPEGYNYYRPILATSDGGVISKTADNQTLAFNSSQAAVAIEGGDLPIYSWKGAYRKGSLDSVNLYPSVAATYLAFAGGNQTGNGTAFKSHTLGLVWCDGYTNEQHCGDGNFVQYQYYPVTTDQPNQAISFIPNYFDYIGSLRAWASLAFSDAFAKLPITILPRSQGTDYTVYVANQAHFAGEDAGPLGIVYYFDKMQAAQEAAGWWAGQGGPQCGGPSFCDWSPLISDRLRMYTLIRAIGTGVGRAAAHETGHYLQSSIFNPIIPLMDCGLGKPPGQFAVQGCDDHDNFVYEFFKASGLDQDPADEYSIGGQFFFVDVPGHHIHWGKRDNCFIKYNWVGLPKNNDPNCP